MAGRAFIFNYGLHLFGLFLRPSWRRQQKKNYKKQYSTFANHFNSYVHFSPYIVRQAAKKKLALPFVFMVKLIPTVY